MSDAALKKSPQEISRATHRLGIAGIVAMFSLATVFLCLGCVLPD
jgi:hypothetical protein